MSENDTMKDEFVTDVEITRFLLGDVDDAERQRLESLFISDPESRERILVVENELIDNYLDDSLPALDRDKFVAQYGDAPQHRRKIRIAKSITDYAVAEAMPTQMATSSNPRWRTLLSSLGPRKPKLFIPVAATLTVACVIAVVWLVRLNSRRTQENNRRAAIERELADLNTPSSLREVGPQMFSMILPPVSVRSVGPPAELMPRTEVRVVELRLVWTQKEQYLSYRAVLRRVGHTEQFTIPNLHVESSIGGSVVRVRLPAHRLTRGQYRVNVSGVAGDGAQGPVEEYTFTVGG
jgi:hypothetical protein